MVTEYGEMAFFRKVNVEGTHNVARAAREAGVSTFVHVSSVAVYGFDFPDRVTEEGPRRGENNPYCQTKIEAEDAILQYNDPETMGVVIIRPGDVYGPGSIPWIARPLDNLRRGRMYLPRGGRGLINHVYVDNVVDAIFLAIEKRAYGEAFNITDGVGTTFKEFYSRLAAIAGLPPPVPVPTWLAKTGAVVITRLRDRGWTDNDATVETVKYLMRRHVYSIDKARSVLGYEPAVDLERGLQMTEEYIRAYVAASETGDHG